jgi:hypothetical protein
MVLWMNNGLEFQGNRSYHYNSDAADQCHDTPTCPLTYRSSAASLVAGDGGAGCLGRVLPTSDDGDGFIKVDWDKGQQAMLVRMGGGRFEVC